MTDALATALSHHRAGELDRAANLYRELLSYQPEHPDALHLLGVVALQRGEVTQSIALIERAIALSPGSGAFHGNLAEAYRLCGNLERAIACCQVALQLQPDSPDAANNLGSLLVQRGSLAEASELFERALRGRPDFVAAHNNLGNVCRLRGDREQALEHFRQAVTLDPKSGHAHGNLGQLLLEFNRLEGALHHCREAVRLEPEAFPALNNLGNVLRKCGQLLEAKTLYTKALRLQPNLGMVHSNLGQILQEEGKLEEALSCFRRAVDLEPTSASFRATLAGVLTELGNQADAEFHYREALRYDAKSADAHLGLGRLRDDQGRLREACEEYRAALQLQPDHAGAHYSLGKVLLELNQYEPALESLRSALRADPRHALALAHLATHLRDKLPNQELAALEAALADPLLPDNNERAALLFALAQVRDAQAQYDDAALHADRANALEHAIRRQRGLNYNAAAHADFVDRLLNAFDAPFFDRLRAGGSASRRPIFIVGLPRSGTTLLEQVFASHSQVFGAGELRAARGIFQSLGASEAESFDALSALDVAHLGRLANDYLERLDALDTAADCVTDKMPDNYLYLGLLAALFPNAHFLHCRRDLRDVAISCWMTNFREIPWSNDPEELASRFAQYRRVMDHWQKVLPVPVLEVAYEDMVGDFGGTARRAIAWCGLDWEPACEEFHRSVRPVRTASVAQVRQPLYRSSLARWRHYSHSLQPLLDSLPLENSPAVRFQHAG